MARELGLETTSIRLEGLRKEFGRLVAVEGVDLTIEAGELVCLLGPSGCGKTTTLRMIGGFEDPTAGHIWLGEQEVTHLPPYQRPTAMVFQSYALFPHMTVFDNISYGLRARRTPRRQIEERVAEVVRLMELGGQERKAPPQLSGGQQQRVALARALVIQPKVLLLDEPLSNLDAKLRVRMRSEIRELQRRLGITSVYVTHDQEEAFSIADRVALMDRGRLIQVGSPFELYRRPADRFVAEFVGLSNVLPARLLESGPEVATVEVLGQQLRVASQVGDGGRQLAVVLRPEALSLRPGPDGAGIPARVVSVAFLGPLARYVVEAAGEHRLTVDMHNPQRTFAEGAAVRLRLPDEVPALLPQ